MIKEESFFEKTCSIGKDVSVALITSVNPLANAIYQVLAKQEMKNFLYFVEKLQEKVESLEENLRRLAFECGKSERGGAFYKYSFQRVGKTSRKEQIEQIISIIITCFTSNIITEDDAEILVDIVSDLSVREERFLCELYEKLIEIDWACEEERDSRETWKFDDPFFRSENRLEPQEQEPIFNRLIAKGLLVNLNTTTFFASEQDPLLKSYEFTKLGKLLVKVIYGR